MRRELGEIGIPPLKRFGQHFLIDKSVRGRLVELAGLTVNDLVLEVGPGLGFLTTELVKRAGLVVAIEKDRTLAAYLKEKFAHQENLTVIEGDALTVRIPENAKIVSSPPYNISSKLVLLITSSPCRLAALLLQEEFVRRLTASNGTREYGRISVMLQQRARAEFDRKVPRESFYPKPRVDSALVTITPTKQTLPVNNQDLFTDLVRGLFTQRRRKLRGVLTRYLKARYPTDYERILKGLAMADKRVHELSPDEFVNLSNEIAEITNEPGRD